MHGRELSAPVAARLGNLRVGIAGEPVRAHTRANATTSPAKSVVAAAGLAEMLGEELPPHPAISRATAVTAAIK